MLKSSNMQFYAKTTFERIEKFVEKSFGVRLFLKMAASTVYSSRSEAKHEINSSLT